MISSEAIAVELKKLIELDGNKTCADCPSNIISYADLTNNNFICNTCAIIHEEFQYTLKNIHSNVFDDTDIAMLASVGNIQFNMYYLASFNSNDWHLLPTGKDSLATLKKYLHMKYTLKKWHIEKNIHNDINQNSKNMGKNMIPSTLINNNDILINQINPINSNLMNEISSKPSQKSITTNPTTTTNSIITTDLLSSTANNNNNNNTNSSNNFISMKTVHSTNPFDGLIFDNFSSNSEFKSSFSNNNLQITVNNWNDNTTTSNNKVNNNMDIFNFYPSIANDNRCTSYGNCINNSSTSYGNSINNSSSLHIVNPFDDLIIDWNNTNNQNLFNNHQSNIPIQMNNNNVPDNDIVYPNNTVTTTNTTNNNTCIDIKSNRQPECIICLANPPTHLSIPCGHKAYCEHCSNQWKDIKICAVCRVPITGMIKVYYI